MLNDISGLPSWGKLRRGMARVWEGEVLKKFVVIQHWRFGEILRSVDGAKECDRKWKGGIDKNEVSSKAAVSGGTTSSAAPTVKYIINASGVKVPINIGNSSTNSSKPSNNITMMKAPWAK